jgi:hypothetical protein
VWSFDAEMSRWPSGWNVSTYMFESCAWESVVRGVICGVSAESAGAACDSNTGEVAAADDDKAVGKFGVVHAIGEEMSQ